MPRTSFMRACRTYGAPIALLSSISLAATPASASVEAELEDFFDGMGAQANVTGPSAFNGQRSGHYTGGGLWARFPTENVDPINIQMPSVSAGCGGIDVFSGSFSFINSDQLVALFKATANNALGFAFKLAISSISPVISDEIDELADIVQQANEFNINSCESAAALVGSVWGAHETASSHVCRAIGNSQGIFSDMAASRHGCNDDGQRGSTISGNTNPDIPAENVNFTWKMLNDNYPSFSREFKEYLMSLVGTVIHTYEGDAGPQGSITFAGSGSEDLFTALLDGGTDIEVLDCNDDECLSPTTTTVTITASEALKPRVLELLRSIAAKIESDEALNSEEIGLLGMSAIPLYKIMAVNAASTFNVVNEGELATLAEAVAVDILESFTRRNVDYVNRGSTTFQNMNPQAMASWRSQIADVRESLTQISRGVATKVQAVNSIIERSAFIETTLRNEMSPQLNGALNFGSAAASQAAR